MKDSNPTLQAALSYLERGWSVIPLDADKKTPYGPWAAYQYIRPTEDQLRHWFADGTRNVGIVTGRISDLVVLDYDVDKYGAVYPFSPDGTDVYTVRTPHGFHAYVRPTTAIDSCKFGVGIDFKGEGGYVVAPPSRVAGQSYMAHEGPFRTLEELGLEADREAVRDSGRVEVSEPWIAATLSSPGLCTPGSQDETLTKLAWYAAHHWPQDIAVAVLWTWLAAVPCSGAPWTKHHVVEKVDRAYRKAVPNSEARLIDDQRPLSEKVRTADVVTQEDDSTKWLIPDFLAPGSYTELLGPMKEGKTSLAMSMVAKLVTGQPFLERPVTRCSVLYLTEQTGVSLRETLLRSSLSSTNLHILTISDIFREKWANTVPECVRYAREAGIQVIVVDTLSRLAGVEDEQHSGVAMHMLHPFAEAREANIAALFIRHTRKSGGAINMAGRGSGAITGEMDICLRLTAVGALEENVRLLEWVNRFGSIGEEQIFYREGEFLDALGLVRHALVGHGMRTFADLKQELDLPPLLLYNSLQKLIEQRVITLCGDNTYRTA